MYNKKNMYKINNKYISDIIKEWTYFLYKDDEETNILVMGMDYNKFEELYSNLNEEYDDGNFDFYNELSNIIHIQNGDLLILH